MTEKELEELTILREIARLVKENYNIILTDMVLENCACKSPKMKRVHRCPGAFQIDMLLEKLYHITQP